MLSEFVEWFKKQSKKRQFLIISALEEEFSIKANYGYIEKLKGRIKDLESIIKEQEETIKTQKATIKELSSYKGVIEENKKLRWKLKRHENKVY